MFFYILVNISHAYQTVYEQPFCNWLLQISCFQHNLQQNQALINHNLTPMAWNMDTIFRKNRKPSLKVTPTSMFLANHECSAVTYLQFPIRCAFCPQCHTWSSQRKFTFQHPNFFLVIMTCAQDQYRVKEQACQISRSKVTHSGPTVLPGLLRWSVKFS